jgi:reverse gyrase
MAMHSFLAQAPALDYATRWAMGQRYRKNPLSRGRIVDGLALVVNDTRRLHTLNPTATQLWQMAERGVSADEAIADLSRAIDIDRERVRQDVEANLDELVSRHILVAD